MCKDEQFDTLFVEFEACFNIWPQLTFNRKWPSNSPTELKMYDKLYIFWIVVIRRVIWDVTWLYLTIFHFWPLLTPHLTPMGRGQMSKKKLSKCLASSISIKTTSNSILSKVDLRSSCAQVFMCTFITGIRCLHLYLPLDVYIGTFTTYFLKRKVCVSTRTFFFGFIIKKKPTTS